MVKNLNFWLPVSVSGADRTPIFILTGKTESKSVLDYLNDSHATRSLDLFSLCIILDKASQCPNPESPAPIFNPGKFCNS